MYYGLTPLGILHTAISLIAVAAAIAAFLRDGRIIAGSRLGRVYIWTTVLTCLTGFGIFQHGGFGKPHMLGVVTLVVLAVAALAGRRRVFGNLSPYVETVLYSLTFFFHMIPAVTETSTRLPYGKPWLPNADAPELQTIAAGMFLLFLVGATAQVLRLRTAGRQSPAAAGPLKA